MSFIIFDETTSLLVMGGKTFKTARGANQSALAYIKRRLKKHFDSNQKALTADLKIARHAAENWTVFSLEVYNIHTRPVKTVRNLMSGKEITIDANTPACCDPSTETYWSM